MLKTVKVLNGSLSHNAFVRSKYAPLMGRTFNDSTALYPIRCKAQAFGFKWGMCISAVKVLNGKCLLMLIVIANECEAIQ